MDDVCPLSLGIKRDKKARGTRITCYDDIFSHKFIFVRNYKVAGTSVKNVLRPYQPFYLRTGNIHYALMKGYQIGFKPMRYALPIYANALEIRTRLPQEIYDNFFKSDLS